MGGFFLGLRFTCHVASGPLRQPTCKWFTLCLPLLGRNFHQFEPRMMSILPVSVRLYHHSSLPGVIIQTLRINQWIDIPILFIVYLSTLWYEKWHKFQGYQSMVLVELPDSTSLEPRVPRLLFNCQGLMIPNINSVSALRPLFFFRLSFGLAAVLDFFGPIGRSRPKKNGF